MNNPFITPQIIRDLSNNISRTLFTDAIFSDETENYLSPPEPKVGQSVTFTIRTLKDNADEVYFHINNDQYLMAKKDKKSSMFSYFSHVLTPLQTSTYYYSIVKNGDIFYYNKKGTHSTLDNNFNFKVTPGFSSPNWAKGAVMYQIFVDRFYNSDKSNDVLTKEYNYLGIFSKKEENWEAEITNQDFCTFYGGDLQGIIDKMPYLQDLGIQAIYLTPIFVSPSSHKYDIQDYDNIDPHLGIIINDGGKTVFDEDSNKNATMYKKRTTDEQNLKESNKLFAKMVKTAHNAGIKVILDGVFNHSGSFHKWLNKEGIYDEKGAYQTKDTPFVQYFKWYGENWPNNIAFDGWWGHSNHPKLNYENSKELYDYILNIGKKWVSPPYNADGWRLDVAADLGQTQEFNHKFWRDFRKTVKTANKEAIILGEHYGDCYPWLQGDQWDTIMNYDAFMEPITWFLTGMQKHSEEFNQNLLNNSFAFENSMVYHMSRMNYQSMYTSMNQLSNHDHSRFLTRTNMKIGRLHTVGGSLACEGINKSIMYEAVVFQMTWPGAPTLYYGDEAGLTGWTDPDNRRPYPWGKEDKQIISFHKAAIALRCGNEALRTGSVKFLHNQHGVISYARWNECEKFAIIINNNDHSVILNLPIWKLDIFNGTMSTLLITENNGFNTNKKSYQVVDGYMQIYVNAFSAVVLSHNIAL